MSQENVEIVREAFARWNERDIEYWIRHAQPDGRDLVEVRVAR
jgi:hypothetical protein